MLRGHTVGYEIFFVNVHLCLRKVPFYVQDSARVETPRAEIVFAELQVTVAHPEAEQVPACGIAGCVGAIWTAEVEGYDPPAGQRREEREKSQSEPLHEVVEM